MKVSFELPQLRRETEALGRKAAQLQGSNEGLVAKLDAQRKELSSRMRAAQSESMQVCCEFNQVKIHSTGQILCSLCPIDRGRGRPEP